MIASYPVDGAAAGVTHQSKVHSLLLDELVDLQTRLKGLFADFIGHQLNTPKQTPPADIADGWMVSESLLQAMLQFGTPVANIRQ